MTSGSRFDYQFKDKSMAPSVAQRAWLACIGLLSFGVASVANAQWVEIDAPLNGTSHAVNTPIALAASADGEGVNISKILFKQNGVNIGPGDTTAPYTASFTPTSPGTYVFTAHLMRIGNSLATSAPVTVTVAAAGSGSGSVPVGVFQGIDASTAIASGSASDADRPEQSIELHFYLGTGFTTFVGQGWTQASNSSFAFQIPAQYRDGVSRSFCAYAINDAGIGPHPQLGCKTFAQANRPPTGTLTSINATGVASGSASDADRPGQSIALHFYLGTDFSTFLGGTWTQANDGSFTFQIPAQYLGGQSQTVCAWAIDEVAPHPQIGCKPTVASGGGGGGSGPNAVTRTYVYDSSQRLCKTINPESGATVIEYDAAGNIHWTADGTALTGPTCDRQNVAETAKTYRSYDAMNRVVGVTTPYGEGNISTTYTPDGLVASSTSNNIGNVTVTNTYAYNKRRLLVSETSSQPGWYTWHLGYAYNANGHLSALTYPSGIVVGYAPNALGQPTQVGGFASGISYYPNGAIKQFAYGNGIVHTMTPNLRGLPMRSQDMNGSTAILDDNYTFDANANVSLIIDQAQGTARGMSYDKLDRLMTAVSTPAASMWGEAHYTYDALDNLRTSTLGASGYSYGYDANNRLVTLARNGGGLYAYATSPRGNITNDGRQDYVWDSVNRLYAVGGKEYYRYDSLGRRVLSWRPTGQLSLFMYSKAGHVLHVEDGMRAQTTTNVYLGNSLLATRSVVHATGAEVIRYQHTDALGSPVAVTDTNRAVVERTIYAPYGAPVNRPVEGVGYTGHVMDQTTGMIYMQQRYYDPQIGRFLSTDPVAARVSGDNFNRYWYANNSPYRFTDPDGREPSQCEITTRFPRGGDLSLPTRPPVVTSAYGDRIHPVTGEPKLHNGTDFRARLGEEVRSTQTGKVASITVSKTGGDTIMVANRDGSLSGYAHTGAAPGVEVGSRVGTGDTLGHSNGSGRITAPHLHYTYRPGTVAAPATVETPTVDPVQSQFKLTPIRNP